MNITEENPLQPLACNSFSLIIGVICGSITQIKPLLNDINTLRLLSYLQNIEVHILANGEKRSDVDKVATLIFAQKNSPIAVTYGTEQTKVLSIGQARSQIQKCVGKKMLDFTHCYAWILDDDMRIPNEAHAYLTWLPAFKKNKIDVLVGNFNGGSPNPPAHGIRVQLNDLIHNLKWLNGLQENQILPNRERENERFRLTYPDYYYDLSRKHDEHLGMPYWITPECEGESVLEAKHRVIKNVFKILTGEPFLRPLIVPISKNPLLDSKPSCNRGGNTFILNSEALLKTPNAILLTNGEENRRSDMIWAIINRYYHSLTIQSVSFPVYHHRFVNVKAKFNLHKTVSEIRGAALYAAMIHYFESNPLNKWHNLPSNGDIISIAYAEYVERRLLQYSENFSVITQQLKIIESEYLSAHPSINSAMKEIKTWVSKENFNTIASMVNNADNNIDIVGFIASLNTQIDAFCK
ncbi:hypothetical protein [Shewanella frigidimarina]|uniref:Uncharacterized protein n=1 Tax=Shewanella frigidimarina TaxID=56812 RepID=A0A106C2J9_SHEFR|nr:hypothetical protein [Shewanella frigidimarina]KVX03051.1 hypothetical protein AWJ07_00270 [Shewanella frigidimarina]